jgi:hypothetical protein
MLQPKDLVGIEVVPAAERLLSHTDPERTFPKMRTAAAEVVSLQPALPKVGQAPNGNKTRQLSEEQREDCAA